MLRSVERQARQIDAIEAERREAERRETGAPRSRTAGSRTARGGEARTERRAARGQRCDLPMPPPSGAADHGRSSSAADRTRPRARRVRAAGPTPPAADRAPALPPPLNIGPAPGSGKSAQPPRPGRRGRAKAPAAVRRLRRARRSIRYSACSADMRRPRAAGLARLGVASAAAPPASAR